PPCAPDFARTGPDRAATPASESRRDAWTRLYKNDCRRASSAVDRFHRRDPAVVEGRPGKAGAARVSGGLGAWGPFEAPHLLIAEGGGTGSRSSHRNRSRDAPDRWRRGWPRRAPP